MTYYHGGAANIRGYILPPNVTNAPSLSEYGAKGIHRRDKVYLTTDYQAALLFAAGQKDGMVYECEPVGPLDSDPDCIEPGLSWQCDSARILRSIKPQKSEIRLALLALLGRLSDRD